MQKVIFLLFVFYNFLNAAPTIYIESTDKYYTFDLIEYNRNYYTPTTTYHPLGSGYLSNSSPYVLFQNCSPDAEMGADWEKCVYRYYSTSLVASCPEGLVPVNGLCSNPPPDPDADGDGTPDKCDFDHPDYLTSDCDNDGIPNGNDDDIDGDGSTNDIDADMNNDGVQDSTDPNSPTYDASCKGPDTSLDMYPYGVLYPFSYYKFRGAALSQTCRSYVDTDANIDSSISVPDINQACPAFYCYVHVTSSYCPYWASDFIPHGSNWIISTIKNEQECSAAVDDINYIDKSWAYPDSVNCPMDKWCYLKTVEHVDDLPDDTNSENDDPTMASEDLNSTTSELSPLLSALNTTNKHLGDLKDKTDYTNNSLDDLKEISNKTLNNNIDMKTILKNVETNSESFLSNQLQGLSSLSSINTNIQRMSDTATSNQVLGNGFLSSIDGKMTTNNNLLTNIDMTQTETKDFVESIKNNLNGLNEDGTSVDTSFLNDSFSGVDSFISDVQSGFTDIGSSYTDLTANINEGFSYSIQSGGSVSGSENVFGKTLTIDPTYGLVSIAPVVYYFTYISMFYIAIKIIFLGFMVV
ncbi:MAG: hypothetical protein AB7D38_07895 [Sulfurimonas sp.]|uniref:hypothetical protein n=1 Tax=Sulfurimonas sp. TaxID=2022749 RepID=UPI003D0E198E